MKDLFFNLFLSFLFGCIIPFLTILAMFSSMARTGNSGETFSPSTKIIKCLNDFDEQIKINNSLESLLKVCERVSK